MKKLIEKGKFEPIDLDFISEGTIALRELQKVQENFNKNDTDTFINELRDQIVGHYLGFSLVNTEKHGFDCKMSKNKDIFLEDKAASYDASSWGATFNDTTIEKANLFKQKNVYLALSVWKDASDLLFICFGQNKKIGEFLEEKVSWFKKGNTVRSTQSISFINLIKKYNFKICYLKREKKKVRELIEEKYKIFQEISDEVFVDLTEVKDYIK